MHVMYFDHIYLHISASRSSQICHHSLSTQFPLLFYTIQYQLMLPSDFRAWGQPPQCSWLTWAFILKQNGLFLSQKPYMVAHPGVGLTPAFHTRIYSGWSHAGNHSCCEFTMHWSCLVQHTQFRFKPPYLRLSQFSHAPFRDSLWALGKGMEYRCLTGPDAAEHSTNAFSLHCDQLWVPELKTDHYKKSLLQWRLKDTQTHGNRDRNVEPLQLLVIAVS